MTDQGKDATALGIFCCLVFLFGLLMGTHTSRTVTIYKPGPFSSLSMTCRAAGDTIVVQGPPLQVHEVDPKGTVIEVVR